MRPLTLRFSAIGRVRRRRAKFGVGLVRRCLVRASSVLYRLISLVAMVPEMLSSSSCRLAVIRLPWS